MDLDSAADEWLSYLRVEKNYSINTTEAYASDLRQWLDYTEKNNIDPLNFQNKDVYAVLSVAINSSEPRNSTRARKLAVFRSFYRFVHKTGLVENDLMSSVNAPRLKRPLPHPVRGSEMDQLLEGDTGQMQFMQLRDKALWECAYSSGMRISELLSLDVSDIFDIDGIKNSVKIKGKGSKERIVFIGKQAAEALENYLNIRMNYSNKKSEELFINQRGSRLTRRGALYLLKLRSSLLNLGNDISPHSMRHSFATDLLNEGADIRVVQEMLGHASVSTTQNYTRVAKEKIRRIFTQSHPHARR